MNWRRPYRHSLYLFCYIIDDIALHSQYKFETRTYRQFLKEFKVIMLLDSLQENLFHNAYILDFDQ
uniref:Uncharacterized protein n=1 Tax=Romanomermis culicivorax TaxID=13658 RepID=A0A915JIT2_ROMCU